MPPINTIPNVDFNTLGTTEWFLYAAALLLEL
jgi:hypothetical protein